MCARIRRSRLMSLDPADSVQCTETQLREEKRLSSDQSSARRSMSVRRLHSAWWRSFSSVGSATKVSSVAAPSRSAARCRPLVASDELDQYSTSTCSVLSSSDESLQDTPRFAPVCSIASVMV